MKKENHYIEKHIENLLSQAPHLTRLGDSRFLYDSHHDEAVVPILSGGGSGHEPAHFGFIGQGMLAGAVAGDIFAPPSSDEILTAIRFLDKGKGVLLIIKNFDADLRVFHSAMRQAKKEGIEVRAIISHDDISVDTAFFKRRHRGVAGTLFLHKILGQAAREGAGLLELEAMGLNLSTAIATLAVATKATTDPMTLSPMFELQENFVSYGVGIHGEGGYKTVPFVSLEKLVVELINKLKMFFRWQKGEHYALLVNNLGETTLSEERTFLSVVLDFLALEDLHIDFVTHGRFMTSLDMQGLSISLCQLKDDRWLPLLRTPSNAPAWPLP